jgi:GNAT superfamily N-acetyltransferase
MIRTEFFTGPAILPQVARLSGLRVAVFREWPYLYDGSAQSEEGFMADFAKSGTSGIAITFDGDQPVGASTAIAMGEESENVAKPFRDAGFDLAKFCYFGESVLLKPYRGQGVGVRYFALREAHARSLPGVEFAAFCAVQRPQDHPLKPQDAVKLDNFWRHRGYLPTDMTCTMRWKQVDSEERVENRLRFWMKRL